MKKVFSCIKKINKYIKFFDRHCLRGTDYSSGQLSRASARAATWGAFHPVNPLDLSDFSFPKPPASSLCLTGVFPTLEAKDFGECLSQ